MTQRYSFSRILKSPTRHRFQSVLAVAAVMAIASSASAQQRASGQPLAESVAPARGASEHVADCACCNKGTFRLSDQVVCEYPGAGDSASAVTLAGYSAMQDGQADCCPPFQVNSPSSTMFPPGQSPFQGVYAPDEFVCDGGDRMPQVQVGADWTIKGLDLEDTVGHYDTLTGQRIAQPSNRVCIYAPRFAAVRKISGAVAANSIDAPVQTIEQMPNRDVAGAELSSTTLQNLQPRRNVGVVVVDSLRDRTRGLTIDNNLVPTGFSGVFAAHEDFQILRTGTMDNAEKARLAIRIDAAKTWESALGLQVMTGGQKPMIVRDALVAMEERGTDRDGQPKLRIYKVASKSYARPGDEIEFTIRIDNIGTEVMGNVTIIDNLSGRLEYVDGSAQCSLAGEFKTEQNIADSSVLRWEIQDPMKPGEGGVIRFTCRVR